ncbi:MAG: stimulus-sensing domain-containing protein [Alphaproteobacteria bacterium]|nr:stimulus-sensing domain-containing protein [Alphaproteobacteria bacterium]
MSVLEQAPPETLKPVGKAVPWLKRVAASAFGKPVLAKAAKGLSWRPRRRWMSALTAKVIAFNVLAVLVFFAGAYWIQTIRVNLVDERIKSLKAQAEIVAAALARYAARGEEDADAATDVDEFKAVTVLNLLVGPTGMRARIFDREGRPIQDTRFILLRNQVKSKDLPPPGQIDLFDEIQSGLRSGLYSLRPGKELPPIVNDEPQQRGEKFEEVQQALQKAEPGAAERINAEGNLIVSVAVPIRRLQFVMGVLMLSTEAGDIDDALRDEWVQLVAGVLTGSAVVFLASILLLWHVTGPVRQLSQGAELVRSGGRALNAIPNFGRRNDEVGDLSMSLRAMTAALYARMDAIEQFAADVAHEIKNPLTSVASAIETLRRTDDEEKRLKLMGVVRDDVRRLNRLITDISDASRLDAELSRAKAQAIDLSGLINALAQMFDDPDVQGKPRIVLDVPADGLVVRGLEGPLAQVLRNVIENAISFSPAGGEIHISVKAARGHAVIWVDDQGTGIPEENLEVIFRRFYTSRPLSHGFGKNSGLGLSISRQIIEVHDGKISASNLRGEDGTITGARFIIELPLAPAS